MEEKFFTVKEVALNNRCPECYSNEGLKLTFKQKNIENTFYRAISNDIKHTLICHTCNTEIFPVSWTNEFERIYEYQFKAFVPKRATIKLKKMSWILLILFILSIILLSIYFFSR